MRNLRTIEFKVLLSFILTAILGTSNLGAAAQNMGGLTADGPTTVPIQSRRIVVLTTIPALECFTRNVAGELEGRRVFIEQFLSAGQDPHHGFDLGPADRLRLGRADLLIINGLQLETWLKELMDD